MMDIPEGIRKSLESLEETSLGSRVRAVEELARYSQAIASRVAALFEDDEEARPLVFERLGRFGSLMVEPMERVFRDAADETLKHKSASALLYLGSDIGASLLLGAVRVGNPYCCMAAISLSAAGIVESAALIDEAIIGCELSDTKTLECLTSALRSMNHPMSEQALSHLSTVEPAWLRHSLLG
jgi:hypothetical protein